MDQQNVCLGALIRPALLAPLMGHEHSNIGMQHIPLSTYNFITSPWINVANGGMNSLGVISETVIADLSKELPWQNS